QPMMLTSLLLVAVGIGAAAFVYRSAIQDRQRDPLERVQPALFRFLANRMWLDELYGNTVILLSKSAAGLTDWLDRFFWDGFVRAAGALAEVFGIFTAKTDDRGINTAVDQTMGGGRGFGRAMSAWHSGQIQIYLGVIAIGAIALLLLYAWLG
ncbi:MAG: hypothetical protein DME34_03550, partial [Verrucomicrobia bacterium]